MTLGFSAVIESADEIRERYAWTFTSRRAPSGQSFRRSLEHHRPGCRQDLLAECLEIDVVTDREYLREFVHGGGGCYSERRGHWVWLEAVLAMVLGAGAAANGRGRAAHGALSSRTTSVLQRDPPDRRVGPERKPGEEVTVTLSGARHAARVPMPRGRWATRHARVAGGRPAQIPRARTATQSAERGRRAGG